jgi:vancomycin resistance protein YoaR
MKERLTYAGYLAVAVGFGTVAQLLVGFSNPSNLAMEYAVKEKKDSHLMLVADTPIQKERAATPIKSELISKYSTTFPASNKPRSFNIKLACELINGTVIYPGEAFSYNTVVGRRTPARGFKLATVFSNGKRVPGYGGGVCQVSTTLYNAAMLANLKIIERHNHSLPVHYVPHGRDATVSYGSADLVFENTLPQPIKIMAKYATGKITLEIYGENEPNTQVKIESRLTKLAPLNVVYKVDKSLAPGSEMVLEKGGKSGRAETTRLIYKDGELVKKETMKPTFYRGGTRIIAHNPSAPQTPAEQ